MEANAPDYVPDCYLCPGNMRVSGKRNLDYTSTFVFDNDLPSVSLDAPGELSAPVGIYRNRSARGIARVVCYSPLHSLTLAQLETDEVVELLRVWQEQYRELGSREEIKHVLVFENKGEAVGVSRVGVERTVPPPVFTSSNTLTVCPSAFTVAKALSRLKRMAARSGIV